MLHKYYSINCIYNTSEISDIWILFHSDGLSYVTCSFLYIVTPVCSIVTTLIRQPGDGQVTNITMGSEKANTDGDGLSNKRLNIENPLDALPKDKGWAWMCLLGKKTTCFFSGM